MALAGVVMAAGEGRRMRSRIPKPLHKLCGKEMIRYPVDLLREAGAESVLVVVSPENRDAVRAILGGLGGVRRAGAARRHCRGRCSFVMNG